ncbi:MAG TPA: PEP-CTERM sorting domain-containing protein [Pirellulales bacterium]|jgi:hypothetical protein
MRATGFYVEMLFTMVVLFASSNFSQAMILSTSAAVSVISPPANVSEGKMESNTTIWAFPEEQNVTLAQDLAVDVSLPGTSPLNGVQNLTPGNIGAGNSVSSYFVHFDAVGAPTNAVTASGSITFDQNIVGLIVLTATLEDSNTGLGFPGTIYDNAISGEGAEGLEIVGGGLGKDSNDQITLSADRHTVSFSFRDTGSADDFRVVTSVPEPSTLFLVLAGAAFLGAWRWRRSRYFNSKPSTTVADLGACNAAGSSAS